METRKVIVSVGVGTAVLFGLGVLMLVLAVVGISALHFLPAMDPAAKVREKVFPRLNAVPNSIPKRSIDEAQNYGPLNEKAREEEKSQGFATSDQVEPQRKSSIDGARDLVAALVAYKFPALALGVLDRPDEEKTQSNCPTCPNYRPPSAELLLVPSYPPPQLPRSPTYYPTPQPQPLAAPSSAAAAGTWFTGPRGPVWIPRGFTYEHDSGLIRNNATGERSVPITPETARRPTPRKPAGLPYQPPLADDQSNRVRPAVPDFTQSPRGERKTGGYACANCKRPTVGDQWATQWTDEGTPISYLCRECWEKMTPEQRQSAYVEWYRRALEQ
jgi:hypothetical protein